VHQRPDVSISASIGPDGFDVAVTSFFAGRATRPDQELADEARHQAADPDPLVRQAAASSSFLPADAIEPLVHDADPKVRRAVAWAPRLADEHMLVLARDPVIAVRVALVRRHYPISDAVLLVLAADSSVQVRRAVAGRGASIRNATGDWEDVPLPRTVHDLLLDDSAANVRRDLAENTHNPLDRLSDLLDDSAAEVRKRAAGRLADSANYNDPALPGLLRQAAASTDPSVRAVTAGHTRTPLDLLPAMAADPAVKVRAKVAGERRLSADDVARLVADKAVSVRVAIASHSTLTAEQVALLAGDDAPSVRAAVIRRRDIPDALLEAACSDKAASVRQVAARHPRLPGRLFTSMAKDSDDRVREIISKRFLALLSKKAP
jgi:hypothetical protein